MQLSLFFAPSNPLQALEQTQALSAFWRFASVTKVAQSSKHLLVENLGLEQATGLAKLLLLEEGLKLPDERDVFLVEPVNLMLQRDTVALAEISNMNTANYDAMTALLNTHFEADGINFIPSQSQQYWYLALAQVSVKTVLPENALHQDIHGYQPTGTGANKLKQIMNEAQMLLHEHVINHTRQTEGLLPVNSIWLSGNGELPNELDTNYDVLIGDSVLLNAVHQRTEIAQFDNLSEIDVPQHHHALLIAKTVEQIDWSTLYQMVRRWKVRILNMHIPIAGETIVLTLRSTDCLKFWKKPTSLSQMIQSVSQG